MQEFCDLIRQAIAIAPSPGTREKLIAIAQEAGCGDLGAPDPQLDSGGGGHTDPDG